jgi:beta-lactamase class A
MTPPDPTRRRLLGTAIGGAMLVSGFDAWSAPPNATPRHRTIADLERSAGGRLGVCALDTGSGAQLSHRADERFGLCSTFKLLLAAVILREADQGRVRLDEPMKLPRDVSLPNSPVTDEARANGRDMTVLALAEAAQTQSDNLAANLLLGLVGGPAGFTSRLREAGDTETRLDRLEPELNFVTAGEVRDTTTPAAMARTVARFLTTDHLSEAARVTLVDWMVATKTGQRRMRAGLPADWRAGDKTGTGIADGMPVKLNDVAIAFPPGRAPIVIAAYYESPVRSTTIRDEDQAVLAEVGRIVAAGVARA